MTSDHWIQGKCSDVIFMVDVGICLLNYYRYTEKIYNEINKKVLQEVCAIRQKN